MSINIYFFISAANLVLIYFLKFHAFEFFLELENIQRKKKLYLRNLLQQLHFNYYK